MKELIEDLKKRDIKAFITSRKGELIATNFDVDEAIVTMATNIFNRASYLAELAGDSLEEFSISGVVKSVVILPFKENLVVAVVANEEEKKAVREVVGKYVH